MFGWLRRFRQYASDRVLEDLLAQNRAWKARWRAEHGDEPFPLTAEERQSLREKRDQLSPEERAKVWSDDDERLFGLDEDPPPDAARQS